MIMMMMIIIIIIIIMVMTMMMINMFLQPTVDDDNDDERWRFTHPEVVGGYGGLQRYKVLLSLLVTVRVGPRQAAVVKVGISGLQLALLHVVLCINQMIYS